MQRIEDLYKLHHELGSGGFGKVFLVRKIVKKRLFKNKLGHKLYTLKILKNSKSSFKREVAVLHRIKNMKRSLKLIEYHEFVTYKGKPVEAILLEYSPGITLKHYFLQQDEVRYSERFMRSFILNLLRLIERHHHLGIIHRDIKPSNIIINNNKLKMIDYGLSCFEDATYHCRGISGTHGYIAPEVYRKDRHIDWEKVDIWSIGSLLMRLYYRGDARLTKEAVKEKKYSFDTERIMAPDYIKYVITNMIEKEPRKRLSIGELKKILKEREVGIIGNGDKLTEEFINRYLQQKFIGK